MGYLFRINKGATGTNLYEIGSDCQAAGNVYKIKVTNDNNSGEGDTDENKLNQHIQDAIDYLEAFKKRFNDILELKDFFTEVDNYIEILQSK